MFFLLGTSVSAAMGAGEGQGMAAAGIVIGYGVITGFIAIDCRDGSSHVSPAKRYHFDQ